jgi:FAD/FMN-containing dehydrogenase
MTVAAEGISRLRKEFPAVIERASLAVRQRVPTFGVQGAEYDLMRKVKTAFDPEGRLNPGRHIDGERPE